MKALIVDDDIWTAEQYGATLRRAGFSYVHATNVLEALELLDETPNVIVLDLLLTGQTAFVLLHEIRSHTDLARIPIIVCTNMAGNVDTDTMQAYGVRRVLDKAQMTPDDLLVAVRKVLL